MPRDLFGLTKEYNDDRPFVLDSYDHTVQTGPAPVVTGAEPVEAPADASLDAPAEAQKDAAYDFRVDPEAASAAVAIEDDIPVPASDDVPA